MNLTHRLRGHVVELLPLELDHRDDLVSAASEPGAHYEYTAVPTDATSSTSYIESALVDQAGGHSVPFAVRDLCRGCIVGSTRYVDLAYWNDQQTTSSNGYPSVAEIGATWLAASAQGTGVNTEAKLLMLAHAFEFWGARRVAFKTDVRNQRSRRAIERIGARFEGVRRAHVIAVDGTVRDTAYYSIVAAEWPQVKRNLAARLARLMEGDGR